MVVLAIVSAIAVVVPVWTASNTVASSKINDSSHASTGEQLKPKPACDAIAIQSVMVSPTNGNGNRNLILGTIGGDAQNGGAGNDCILGGAGNDTINGGPGAGDYCDGGAGVDVALNCETMVGIP